MRGGDPLTEAGSQRARGLIYHVWPDLILRAHLDRSVSTIKADAAARTFGCGGAGVVWGVLDSGIDATHPHFAAHDTLTSPAVSKLHRDFTIPSDPSAPGAKPSPLTDAFGHGTHVAGIIAGQAPSDTRDAADRRQRTDRAGPAAVGASHAAGGRHPVRGGAEGEPGQPQGARRQRQHAVERGDPGDRLRPRRQQRRSGPADPRRQPVPRLPMAAGGLRGRAKPAVPGIGPADRYRGDRGRQRRQRGRGRNHGRACPATCTGSCRPSPIRATPRPRSPSDRCTATDRTPTASRSTPRRAPPSTDARNRTWWRPGKRITSAATGLMRRCAAAGARRRRPGAGGPLHRGQRHVDVGGARLGGDRGVLVSAHGIHRPTRIGEESCSATPRLTWDATSSTRAPA